MRYFLEVSYKGTNYAGFQIQKNGATIQGEIEKALVTILRANISLTGSSRTDAGVHAFQNYFHFDIGFALSNEVLYSLNSVLPKDIVVKKIVLVPENAHCRFHATSREYRYFIYFIKNPFLVDTAWFYPYSLNTAALQQSATLVLNHTNFTSFSKRNTQTYTNDCTVIKSTWSWDDDKFIYCVKANRFLRGMVKGLVGTMLQVGRGMISAGEFNDIIVARDSTKANFATPARGLFLNAVEFPASILSSDSQNSISLAVTDFKH